jgi:hypothetical protein
MEESEAKQSLSTFVQRQLAQQMVAGRVEHHYETISKIDGLYYLNGRYSCYEMIGRVRPEEITGNYENSGTYG